jgi:starch synthase
MTHVLFVCSELAPFAHTSGLADACAALPRALAKSGVRATVVMPRYQHIDPLRHALARRLRPLTVALGAASETLTVYEGRLPGGLVTVYLLDHPLFERVGADDADNTRRFTLLGKAALALASEIDRWPDVVHAHDWQGGPALALARGGAVPGRPTPATVLTIHNLAHQGLAPLAALEAAGLDPALGAAETGELGGQLSLLKLGIAMADRITTVSPRYAREICTPAHGAGLDTFLTARQGRLVGILDGIDVEAWDPARDPALPVRYDADDPSGKAACKAALQREVGLPVRAGVPLFGKVARMTEQKGWKLLVEAGNELSTLDAQLVFLGRGERRYEDGIANLARRVPAKCAFRASEDEGLAHRLEAGSDFFLMPSLFEPCGQNQMVSQRYGTVPVVRATGGLDDTVVDYDDTTRTGTGFKFDEAKADALVAAVKRAIALYKRREAFDALVRQIMRIDHGWARTARRIVEVYQHVLAGRATTAATPAPAPAAPAA